MRQTQIGTSEPSLIDDGLLASVGRFLSRVDTLDRKTKLNHRSRPSAASQQWRSWQSAERHHLTLLHLRQRLEAQMFDAAEYPHVSLRRTGEVTSILVESVADVEFWCAGNPANKGRAQAAKTELSALQRSWKQADLELGYSLAVDEEAKAFEKLQSVTKRLVTTSAGSHLDVVAKLYVLISEMQPRSDYTDQPWPELRLILADLVHLVSFEWIDAVDEAGDLISETGERAVRGGEGS